VSQSNRQGFTLIELMAVVVIMALLTSAAAFSFSDALRAARFSEAQQLIRGLDASARLSARGSGAEVAIVFDLDEGKLSRREKGRDGPASYEAWLPASYKIDRVRVGNQISSEGEVAIVVSASGIGRTYAVRLAGPGSQRWLLFAGLTGQITQVEVENESQLDAIFATITRQGFGDGA
jgi:prepilin-type N-terminal cleavage/methylation domain-containing protein